MAEALIIRDGEGFQPRRENGFGPQPRGVPPHGGSAVRLTVCPEPDKKPTKPVQSESDFLKQLRGQLGAALRNGGNHQTMLALRMVKSRLILLGEKSNEQSTD